MAYVAEKLVPKIQSMGLNPQEDCRIVAVSEGLAIEAWFRQDVAQPTEAEVLAFEATEIERVFQRVQAKLNSDEEKRTGKPVNPEGAVPTARAIAATCMLYFGWHYPSEEDLDTELNQYLLSRIYEDPETNTNAQSSVAQKRSALHFTLVMLEGQAFGLDYQAELGAYERTASGQFQAKLVNDSRDWLGLASPKMHPKLPAFASVLSMFQAVMK